MLDRPCRQAYFGELVGIAQPNVSDLVSRGVLEDGAPLRDWLLAYCQRLRDQAASRLGAEANGLDLAQERAALAREQRIAYALKNDSLRSEYAAVEVLTQTLATARDAVAKGLVLLPGQLRTACPALPPAAIYQINTIIAAAHAEWLRGTATLEATVAFDPELDDELPEHDLDDQAQDNAKSSAGGSPTQAP